MLLSHTEQPIDISTLCSSQISSVQQNSDKIIPNYTIADNCCQNDMTRGGISHANSLTGPKNGFTLQERCVHYSKSLPENKLTSHRSWPLALHCYQPWPSAVQQDAEAQTLLAGTSTTMEKPLAQTWNMQHAYEYIKCSRHSASWVFM